MAFPTARKRNNPFAERVRQQRAQQQQRPAAKPKPAPEPKPTPEEQRDTDQPLGDLREVAKLAEGGITAPRGGDDVTLAENGAPEFVIPLKAEQKAAEIAAAASVGIERGMDTTEVLSAAEAWAAPDPDEIDAQVTKRAPGDIGAPKRGRGRPRPQETIDRDNAVHNVLRSNPAGVSKAELARALGEKEQQVYSSLRQLTKEGRAKNRYVKDVGYRWFAV